MITFRPSGRGRRLLLSSLLAYALLLAGAAPSWAETAEARSGARAEANAASAAPRPAVRPRPQPRSAGAAATLGYAAVEGFWVAAGGPSSLASTAAAIAAAESRLEPGVIQAGEPFAETGWGLWQITPGNSAPTAFGSDYQLLDPWNNAEAAVWKYNQLGLNAWSTYFDGTYKSYVQNVSPDTSVTDPGEYAAVNAAPSDTPASPAADPGGTYGPRMPTASGGVFGASQRSPRRQPRHRDSFWRFVE